MKQLFTSLLLLSLLLVGTEAWAAYSLKVAGYDVSTSGTSVQTITGPNITGTITYDPSSRTLTLNNATIDCNSWGIHAEGYINGNDLNIRCYGTNTIKTSSTESLLGAIYLAYKCRVYMYSGSSANGPATVYVKNTGNGTAIRIPDYGGRLDIVGLRLYAEASNNHCVQGTTGTPGDYIFAPNRSYIELQAPEGKNALYGFTGWYTYVNNLSQAFFSDSSHSWSSSKGGIVDASGNLVNSTVIVPPLTIGGVPFSSGNDWSVTPSSDMASYMGLTAGTISYSYSTKTLTMDGVTMNSGSRDLLDSFVSGLTVNLTGTNTLTSSSICMDLYGATTLAGSGSLTATSTGTTVYMNYGRNCPFTINVNGSVLLNGRRAVYNAAGTDYPNNDLILKKAGSGSDYFFTSDEGNETISRVRHLTMEDMDFYTAGCYFDASSLQVKKTGGEVVTGSTVNIYRVTQWYDLYVAGHRLSDVTLYGRFGSPYLKSGSVHYNPDTKTLSISGATIEMPSGNSKEYCSIYSQMEDLTINATGTNSWTSEFVGLNLGGSGTTNIKGTGSLKITSTANSALNTFGTTNLTLARSSGTMAVKGKKYGFNGRPSTTFSINKDGSGACYEFAGETANIGAIPTLSLGSGVRIATVYQWFNDEQQAVYCKDAIAHSSDTEDANATWIRGDVTWTTYPVYVGGTQFYGWSGSGNINGLWNKYVKGGDIRYNPSTSTLNLSNAIVDKGDASNVNCIYSNKDGLIVNVTGSSELRSTGGGMTSMNLDDNTTIKGTGMLNVTGSYGGIYLYGEDKKLTLDDVNVNAEYNIYGGNQKGNLEINISSDDKEVMVQGAVYSWKSITLGDGTAVLSPAGAYVANDRIYAADGSAAHNVVIGKFETYDLKIAGTPVTNANCSDVLGNGVFSYDDDTKMLTISGDCEYNGWVIESHIEDLTINVASESTLVSTRSGSSIIRLYESTCITGGPLTLESAGNGLGIYISNGDLTLDYAWIYIDGDGFDYGITGDGASGAKLYIRSSDIKATANGSGAIYDWEDITLEDCWVIEPLPAQILSYGIADSNGDIVGYDHTGTVVITSDRDLYDDIHSVSTDDAAPSEVYDLSGRKLGQARSGVNIIRQKDGKVVKELRK